MALIICPECSKQISNQAAACPYCGYSLDYDRYMVLARRARDDNNTGNAAKYYDLAMQRDPFSWEASFYQVYYTAMNCKIGEIQSAANSVSSCLHSVLTLVRDRAPEKEQLSIVASIVSRCDSIARLLDGAAFSHYAGIDSSIQSQHTQEYVNNACAARDINYQCGTQIDRIFSEKPEIAAEAAQAWKAGVEMHKALMPRFDDKEANQQTIAGYVEQIGKYDPEYARKFALENKINEIKRLEKEIKGLKSDIEKMTGTKKTNNNAIFFLGVGCLLVGIVWSSLFLFWALIGVICFIGAFAWKVPETEAADANREKVEETRKQLSEKEAELNALKE